MAIKNEHFNENASLRQGSGKIAVSKVNNIKFAMSPKDLNLLQSVPEMIELGIDSLKVEGRMKSIHYVATVVSTYRKLIDLYCVHLHLQIIYINKYYS